jgi:hypothetical protein
MLVCSANWLLPDGGVSLPPTARELATFQRGLQTVSGRAGFRSDGRYQPISRVDLVFAGDMLDTLSSTRWLGATRPWQGTPASCQLHTEIAVASLRRGQRALALLRRLHRDGIAVPEATRLGRPSPTHFSRVPVRLITLAGDHDLPWPTAPTSRDTPEFAWSPAVSTRWGDNSDVFISHGQQLDPTAASAAPGEDRPPSVRESVGIDLVTRFLQHLGQLLPEIPLQRFGRSLAAAHPLSLPQRIQAWLDRHQAAAASRTTLRSCWQRCVADWHRSTRRETPVVRDLGIDVCDRLAGWLSDSLHPNASPTAPQDLSSVLQSEPSAVVAAVCQEGIHTAVLGHLPLHESIPAREQSQIRQPFFVHAAVPPPEVLGLVPRQPQPDCCELAWSAVFEQGEHLGMRHTVSAGLSTSVHRSFAATVIGHPAVAGTVDALQAA